MTKQRNTTLTVENSQPEARGAVLSVLGEVRRTIAWGVLALLVLLLPCSLMAGPIVIKINDLANGPPEVEVDGAPNGFDVYTGPGVNNPDVEDGALITLFGVDTYGSISDWGGRFVDPSPTWRIGICSKKSFKYKSLIPSRGLVRKELKHAVVKT